MNIIMFEDSEHMPISKLFKLYLGDSVIFTGGAENIRHYLDMYIDDNVICYIDYVEDNIETVSNYAELISDYCEFENITIVKIPCIEIFAYLLLNYFSVKRDFCISANNIVEYLVCNTDFCGDMYYPQRSLEKHIKSVTEIKPRCVNTANIRRPCFYTEDCSCGYEHCKTVDSVISVNDKFRVIYDYLPLKFDDGGLVINGSKLDYVKLMDRAYVVACTNGIHKNIL